MLRNLKYFFPPAAGITIYLLLIHFEGGRIFQALAFTSAILGVSGLLLCSIMYVPAEMRETFRRSWPYRIFIYILMLACVVEALYWKLNFRSFIFSACIISSLASINCFMDNQENRALIVAFITSVFIPLFNMSKIINPILNIIFISFYCFGLIIISEIYKPLKELYRTRNVVLKIGDIYDFRIVVYSFLFQAPIMLYSTAEPRIAGLSRTVAYTNYLGLWKVFYGGIVFLYSRKQFKLAFQKVHAYSEENKFLMIGLILMVLISVLLKGHIGMVIGVVAAAVIINESSLIIRGYIKNDAKISLALLSIGIYAGVVMIIQSNIFSKISRRFEDGAIKIYPVLIMVFCLLPIITIRALTRRNGES